MKRISVYIRGMWRFIVVEKYVAYSPERNANDGWTVCDACLYGSPPVSSLVRMTSHNQGLFHLICINCTKRAMRLMSVKECNNYASNWHLTLHCIRGVLLHRLDLLYLLLLKNDNFASFCCSECGSCFLIRHFIDCCHVMFFGGWVRVCCLIRWSELLWLELILVTNLKH